MKRNAKPKPTRTSTWVSASESWLREATAAFSVPMQCKGKDKSKEALVEEVVRAVVTASGAAPGPLHNRRYDPDHWGKPAVAKKAGRKAKRATEEEEDGEEEKQEDGVRQQAELDAQWDLDECRRLLMKIDIDDLKQRLSDSPWHFGMARDSECWLKEAAKAFSVSIWQPRERDATLGYFKHQVTLDNMFNICVLNHAEMTEFQAGVV